MPILLMAYQVAASYCFYTGSAMNSLLIPEPVLLHPLKHHLHYIRQFIKSASKYTEQEIITALQTIGASQLDLYTGELSLRQIAQQNIEYLQRQNLLSPQTYKRYLQANGLDFQMFALSDGSDWVLRWGKHEARYVHLHPARYTRNTIRVKATSLKTAIAIKLFSSELQAAADLEMLNKLRREWLNLPPVKAPIQGEAFRKLFSLLDD